MDKQMIEEMAEIALKNTLTYTCAKQIAMNFYNAGYRKIPEGAVLTSDELKLYNENLEKYREKIMDLRLDKQELMNEISEKDNKIALLEETIECIKFNVDFTRKETAEKFAERLNREDCSIPIKDDFIIVTRKSVAEICKELIGDK